MLESALVLEIRVSAIGKASSSASITVLAFKSLLLFLFKINTEL